MAHVRGERRSRLWSLLTPVSWLTCGTIAGLDFLYRHGLRRTEDPPLPLISVGNLTYGGTNKTPFVEMLARALEERGICPGIVSRGYSGRQSPFPGMSRGGQNGVLILRGGVGDRSAAGDEPLLLSRRLPHVPVAVARKRIDGVRALQKEGVELVLADDAFQHRALGRDSDIVLIDAACPLGSGRLIPAGILREPIGALSRAGLVVLTKADQVCPEELRKLRGLVERFIPPERIFTSRLVIGQWASWDGEAMCPCAFPAGGRRVLAFSAIGSPESFVRSLEHAGLSLVEECRFKDHHRYTKEDLDVLCRTARRLGAEALVCTEKDIYNIPAGWKPEKMLPLWVPRVDAVLDEPEQFFRTLTATLRPRLVVASNGYGEDAIGVLLARRLRARFPSAEVMAFPLVGKGDAYTQAGFSVRSAPSLTPSGGVVKYRLRDLWGDMRAGLLHHVTAQLRDWQHLVRSGGTVRTPLCVGDVYLLLHTLWGSGARPLFAATAKTVRLSGHWRLERALIRHFTLRTWTRDPESAEQLAAADSSWRAVYAGSPIMDLLGDVPSSPPPAPPGADEVPLVLLLPGSRPRAYQDVNLLLDAALRLNSARPCAFRMVLAPTLSLDRLATACEGWAYNTELMCLEHEGGVTVPLTRDPIAGTTCGVSLLMGLGGTANQLCAGLGIPVISIDEKGKRVQKKLLGDAELLVPATDQAIANGALRVLGDPALYTAMSMEGRRRMGSPGALDDVVNYAASELGWAVRESVYQRLSGGMACCGADLSGNEDNKGPK